MPKNTLDRGEVRTTPISRYWTCPYCRERISVSRRGRNALAQTSILTGMVNRHLVTRHPEPGVAR